MNGTERTTGRFGQRMNESTGWHQLDNTGEADSSMNSRLGWAILRKELCRRSGRKWSIERINTKSMKSSPFRARTFGGGDCWHLEAQLKMLKIDGLVY